MYEREVFTVNTILDEWDTLYANSLIDSELVELLKKTFHAGALGMITILDRLAEEGISPEAGNAILESLRLEIDQELSK